MPSHKSQVIIKATEVGGKGLGVDEG